MTVEEYQKHKKELERLKSRIDFARGAVDQILAELKADFGIDSEKEAEKVLSDLKKKTNEMGVLVEEANYEYKIKWSELLSEGEE